MDLWNLPVASPVASSNFGGRFVTFGWRLQSFLVLVFLVTLAEPLLNFCFVLFPCFLPQAAPPLRKAHGSLDFFLSTRGIELGIILLFYRGREAKKL